MQDSSHACEWLCQNLKAQEEKSARPPRLSEQARDGGRALGPPFKKGLGEKKNPGTSVALAI